MPEDPKSDLSVLQVLHQSCVQKYFSAPIPSSADEDIIALMKAFAVDPDKRRLLERVLTDEHSFGLLAFAERMATLAVRLRSPEKVFLGLLAVAVEGFRFDAREDIMVLALLYDSAGRISADPLPLFRSAAKHACSEVAKAIIDFSTRPQQERSIEAMGYIAVGEEEEFRYVRNW